MNAPHDLPAGLLQRAHPALLSDQLAALFSDRIARRMLGAGARLPSVRDCARQHQVSPSTVVAAYDQLQARGLVEARRQRGFFVRETPSGHAAAQLATPRKPLAPPVDATALIRGMFQHRPGHQGPGLGTLPEPWLDAGLLERALRRVLPQCADDLRPGAPARCRPGHRHPRRRHRHHDRRHACAGPDRTHPAAARGRRAGGRAGLGHRVRAPVAHGHASVAGAAWPGGP